LEYDYIVLGGGLAGLAFAHKISSAGKSVLILEKEDQVGGLSRSIQHKGFELDFCAHRFQTDNKELLAEVLSLVPSFRPHSKKSRIYIFGKYLKYPFEIPNLLRAMKPLRSTLAISSFGSHYLYRKVWNGKKDFKTYEQWFIHYFGGELYKAMCYTKKIWKSDPAQLSADWADERPLELSLKHLLKKSFKSLIQLDFSSFSLEDERVPPDGGIFYFGDRGIQILPDSLAREIVKRGSKVLTRANLISVQEKGLEVAYEQNGQVHQDKAKKAIITTIPLHSYYELLDHKSPTVENALGGLKYLDIIFVYLFLNKKRVSNDHWIYFADQDIIFNRAIEFKNWAKKMAPEDQTVLCLDITCFEGDATWEKSDEQLVEECIQSGENPNLFKRQEIVDSKVVRIKNAYPIYDLNYRNKLAEAVRFIEKSGQIFCLGRTGLFKYYNNADHSLEMGFSLAENLLRGEYKSLLNYQIQKASY
jgi:protoporphyrinogen oxidase